ncbi:MAG TPA: hypothetical protein VGO46_16690, partial [Gemmatimonadaceae bacterium]|nr:hypothetical protein [Gemmatimonadaceae bacterium]
MRAFAARIVTRHERVRARLAPLSRVFARLAPTFRIANRITERYTQVSVAPRLALSLVGVREGENVVGRSSSLASVVMRRAERVERTVLTRRALVERVVARAARHEGSLPHAAPQSSASAAPVPRVLRRPIRAPAVEPERQVPQPRARVPEP